MADPVTPTEGEDRPLAAEVRWSMRSPYGTQQIAPENVAVDPSITAARGERQAAHNLTTIEATRRPLPAAPDEEARRDA